MFIWSKRSGQRSSVRFLWWPLILSIVLTPREIGKSSCRLEALFTAGGRDRLKAEVTLVCMNLQSLRSMPWPDDVRERIAAGLAFA